MGQERFLTPGTAFVHKRYEAYSASWDHDHCEFCGVKLVEAGSAAAASAADTSSQGWTTTDQHPRGANYHWVCDGCFEDFASEFGWRVESG
jgi:hypothetical protein